MHRRRWKSEIIERSIKSDRSLQTPTITSRQKTEKQEKMFGVDQQNPPGLPATQLEAEIRTSNLNGGTAKPGLKNRSSELTSGYSGTCIKLLQVECSIFNGSRSWPNPSGSPSSTFGEPTTGIITSATPEQGLGT